MLLVQTFLISLMVYEINGHAHKKEHVSHSHKEKVTRKLSVGRGDKRTIDDEKCKGSAQICGAPKDEQKALTNREKAKKLGLCGNTIVKKGCYDDAAKQLGGKMLIDDEDQVHRTVNYSNNMHDLLCRCSKAALKNGYTLFGITDHAHCWGFNGTESSLASLKQSSGCVNASTMKPFCKESDKICAGAIRFMDVSSFIYLALDYERTIDDGKYNGSTQICGIPKLEHEDLTDIEQNRDSLLCYMVFLKRGCYENAAKTLGGKVLIDESYKSNKANYSDILKDLLCRCAAAAEKNRYGLFGITDDVKCWGFNGNKGNLTLLKKSSHCIHASKTRAICNEDDIVCAGTSKDQETDSYSSSFIYSAFSYTSYSLLKGLFPASNLFTLPHNYVDSARKNTRRHFTRENILHGNSSYHVAPWDSRVIPFEFDPNIDNDVAGYFLRAMYHLERYTCVKFRRKMPNENMKSGYIHMQNASYCYAKAGRQKFERNEVSISRECYRGSAAHEIMHSLGLLHTQQREDRDQYITVKFDNIKKRWISIANFLTGKKAFGASYSGTTFGVPYDFNSIMHYPLWVSGLISIDPGDTVIDVKKKWKKICAKNKFGCIVGQQRGLSKSDTILVNKIFKCEIKPQTSWECPVYTQLEDFKTKYFREFRKDLCLRLSLKQ